MRVSDDNLLHSQVVLGHNRQHSLDVVAGIDDDSFATDVIPDDRAIALQRPNREDFVNHVELIRSDQNKSSRQSESFVSLTASHYFWVGAGCAGVPGVAGADLV